MPPGMSVEELIARLPVAAGAPFLPMVEGRSPGLFRNLPPLPGRLSYLAGILPRDTIPPHALQEPQGAPCLPAAATSRDDDSASRSAPGRRAVDHRVFRNAQLAGEIDGERQSANSVRGDRPSLIAGRVRAALVRQRKGDSRVPLMISRASAGLSWPAEIRPGHRGEGNGLGTRVEPVPLPPRVDDPPPPHLQVVAGEMEPLARPRIAYRAFDLHGVQVAAPEFQE